MRPICLPRSLRSVGIVGGLFSWLAVAAPVLADEVAETEALSPGQVIDLVPLALSKAGVRAYAEESFLLLADFGAADASELRSTFGLRAAGPLSDRFALRASFAANGSFFVYDGDRSQLAADLGLVGEDLFERGSSIPASGWGARCA